MMRKLRRLRALIGSVLALSVAAVSLPTALAADGPGEGLWAEYYSGREFDTYVTGVPEATVDHVWTDGNLPAGLDGVENFSCIWNGRIKANEAGAYTIYSNVDDGAKVYIDGRLVIYDAGPHTPEERSVTLSWEADSYHALRIEYYNGDLGGTMQLSWSTPSKAKEIIPTASLYCADKAATDWVISKNTIAARAHIYWDDSANYEIVVESYDQDGQRTDSVRTVRPRNHAAVWTSDSLPYSEGMTYRAYVASPDGEKISDDAEKLYGVDAYLDVNPADVTGQVSPYLYGACMEDVNHELYGGIWSQMVYGESFAEPAAGSVDGFTTAGGDWKTQELEGETLLTVARQDGGPKMVLDNTDCESGMFSADVWFEGEGPVGFIVKTSKAGPGADNFYGYEVGLQSGSVKVARHENNYDGNSAVSYSCSAAPGKWVNLKVETTRDNIAVYVDGVKAGDYAAAASVTAGAMAFRAWNGAGKYKNIQFQKSGEALQNIPVPVFDRAVSGMWSAVSRGTARGRWTIDKTDPYTKTKLSSGAQSQRITFLSGEGAVGVNNMGLNRKGMSFEKDREYEGYLYARSQDGAEAYVVLESADGTSKYAETKLDVEAGGGWKKYAFTLTSDTKDAAGRMTVELRGAGTVDLGYAFLQPGEWGRYKGLPVRRDVGEKLEEQNLSILRFGGCMANAGDYKWKSMLGAPEDRPTYKGWWYDYSSFGFGIIEFLDLCEALGVVGVPDFNSYETAQDMADFMDFATGTDENNEWVKRRMDMGHPEPYKLPFLQFGNEERVDMSYAGRFNAVAPSIWEKDESVILIVGDFGYGDIITDPNHVTNTASGITNLDAHKSMLELAKANGRTVYFDVHIWTDTPAACAGFVEVHQSLYDALHQVCPGTDTKLVIFEYNAWIHEFNRALGNAFATIEAEKHSDLFAITCSANSLQVDGHNDNGWNQGLVFMNNDSAWLQPPAYVTQMGHNAYQPNLVDARLDREIPDMNYAAGRSDGGKVLTLRFMNNTAKEIGLSTVIPGFTGDTNRVTFTNLTADKVTDTNTAENPDKVKPLTWTVENGVRNNRLLITLAPKSYTVVRIEKDSEPAGQTLTEAKSAAEKAVASVAVSNDTTAGDYLKAVQAVLTNGDIQVSWSQVFAKTPATSQSAGSITGTIALQLGDEKADVEIDAVIDRLDNPVILPGDMDGSGEVTIQDVMEACKVLARQSAGKAPTEDEMLRGNLDGDDTFSIGDVMEICKILARKA
ncbi:MAG: hypothetical protein HFE86_06030 [Clostridiales bacterium]|nr:hypothetical protein [Clostridiales bacterium]